MQRWIARLLGLLFALGVSALGVEILVRVAGRDRPLVWEPEPALGWWHVPGAKTHWREEGDGIVEINSFGMRDVDLTREKPAGTMRIAVFGDSMTEGVQVNLDQTFTRQLEARLRARGLRVQVLNFGVAGYSPLQEYLLYERVGKTFAPDVVLHAVFVDNDIADGDLQLATGQVGAPFCDPHQTGALSVNFSAAEASYRDYHRQPTYTIRRRSAAYRMLSAMRSRQLVSARAQTTTAVSGGIPRRYMLYADPLSSRWVAAWRTFDRVEATFADAVKTDGPHFAIIAVPAAQIVDTNAWTELLVQYPAMAGAQWSLDDPRQRLVAVATQLGVPVFDPMVDFRHALGEMPLFFGRVGHMTSRGHTVMATALERALDAQGWLPAGRDTFVSPK